MDASIKGLNAAVGTLTKSLREPAEKILEAYQGLSELKAVARNPQEAFESAVQKLQGLHADLAAIISASKQKEGESK